MAHLFGMDTAKIAIIEFRRNSATQESFEINYI